MGSGTGRHRCEEIPGGALPLFYLLGSFRMGHSLACKVAPGPITPLCFPGTLPLCFPSKVTVKGATSPVCPVKFHGQGGDFPTGKQGQENPACLGSISVHPWSSGCSQRDFGILGNPTIDPNDSNRLIPEGPRRRGGVQAAGAQGSLARPISGSGAEKLLCAL